MGDAVAPIGTGVDVSAGIVADMPAFGNVTTQSGGGRKSCWYNYFSGSYDTNKRGTSLTGQFVSENP